MPWVQVHLPKKLGPSDFDGIKSEIAGILSEELDKPEQGLTVTFYRPEAFYRAGVPAEDAASVEVKYIGSFALEKKQAVTRRIASFLARKHGTDPMKTIVLFTEVDSGNWGRKGGDFS